MKETIQLKNHALDTLLYPITTSQAVMMSDGVTSIEEAINNIDIATDAQSTTFDNSSNDMIATNVQDAIEENKTSIVTLKNSVNENSSSIATLKTKTDNTNTSLNQLTTTVNNGQRHKLTDNSGYCINVGSADCNTLKTTGKYMGSNMINAPISGQWFFIDVTAHNNIWCEQIATAFAYDQSKYIRYQLNGTWQPWRSL